METNQEEAVVAKKSYFSKVKGINFQNYFITLFIVSIVILIWGYFF